MIPQLWKHNLSWPEWRQMHPHLEDKEAEYLYRAEYQLFENYQSEIRNQTLNRQSNLVNQINYLSSDISSILVRGKSNDGSTSTSVVNEIDGIHYGIFDKPIDTSNPVDLDYTEPSSNSAGLVFALEHSKRSDQSPSGPGDPDSNIWVYDTVTSPSAPPSFSFVPPELVGDFKAANEIMVVGNDMYVVYNYGAVADNNVPADVGAVNKVMKLTNFSVNFVGETITYDSIETVELLDPNANKGGVSQIHGITRDANYIYTNNRIDAFGGYEREGNIVRIPLSGPLSFEVFNIADGGPNADGETREWYGDDFSGTFEDWDGIDIGTAEDITNLGDYIYTPGWAIATLSGPNTLFPTSTRTSLWGIVRLSKGDIENTAKMFFLPDPSILLSNDSATGNFIARGGYIYYWVNRGTGSYNLFKINIEDPSDYIYNTVTSTLNASGSSGRAHQINLWGEDKLVVTNTTNSWVGVYNTSDLSEVGHIFPHTYIDGLETNFGVTDDIAVTGDYAYLPYEYDDGAGNGGMIVALDLNNISPSGLYKLTTTPNNFYAATTPYEVE